MEKEVIDGEATSVEEKEKKEGKVAGFFKKAKEKISDAAYDTKMKSNFNSTHKQYSVYKGSSMFQGAISLYAEECDGYIVAPYESDEIKTDYVIKRDATNEVFYIDSVENTTIEYEFEGRMNSLKSVKISFKEEAKKVEVIKVSDNYYLKR